MSRNLIAAVDGMKRVVALNLAEKLVSSSYLWGFKGNDVLLEGDPKDTITRFTGLGNFFADYKFHDIPNTVYNQVARIAGYGAALISAHASGGVEMIKGAVRAYEEYGPHDGSGILAITVLTSIDQKNCFRIYGTDPLSRVKELATIAKEGGAWGIVCSPQEVGELSTMSSLKGLKFVTPGIRPAGSAAGDQARFATPENAVANGSDLLVIGRPITDAPDPLAALNAIGESLALVRKSSLS
ncbi:MAG: orotidine-5'-phosphate decarboxylase [Minisyncoccia bacterium]